MRCELTNLSSFCPFLAALFQGHASILSSLFLLFSSLLTPPLTSRHSLSHLLINDHPPNTQQHTIYNMAAISNYTVIGTDDDFSAVYQPTTSTVYALNFWAAWAPPCVQMNDVFEELASKNSNIKFIKVNPFSYSFAIGVKRKNGCPVSLIIGRVD